MTESSRRNKAETDALFRIFTNATTPDEITAAIGAQPFKVHYVGQHMYDKPERPIYKENAWLLKSLEPDDSPIETHITALLNVVEPHRDYLRELQQSPGTRIDFFCGAAYVHWIELSAPTLRRLGEFGFPVQFDLWDAAPAPTIIQRKRD